MVSVDEIKKIANDRNLSIKGLERKAGISNGSIAKWVTCSPTITSLEKVAKTLEVSVSDLLKGD